MEKKLRSLLDKVYELEGLIHLALQRDNLKEELTRLLSQKSREISESCDELTKLEERNGEDSKLPSDSSHITSNEDEYVIDDIILDEYFLEEDEEEEKSQKENEKEESRGKLVFSINDRYRFRRSLFLDSDVEFNNTLALVASMENYEEAEDYFINEQGWKYSDSDVSAFLDIIKSYFK